MKDNIRQVREWIERQAEHHPLGDVRTFSSQFGGVHTWLTPQQPWTPTMQLVVDNTFETFQSIGIAMTKEEIASLFNLEYPGPEEQSNGTSA